MLASRAGLGITPKNISPANAPTEFITRTSPLDNSLVWRVPNSNAETVRQIVELAHSSKKSIAESGVVYRSRILAEFVQKLKENKDLIIAATRLETGKSSNLAESELFAACEFMQSLAGFARFESGSIIPSQQLNRSVYAERVALGAGALITSFNTPLPNYAWKFAPSFLAGNASILKASELTPLSSTLFGEYFNETNPPTASLQVVHGGSMTGKLLAHSELDFVSFTGSDSVGIEISKNLNHIKTKMILEMGGNNPFIVHSDAKLEEAVEYLIESAFSNSGQRCAAASRLLIEESIFDQFLERLKASLGKIKIGISETDFMGPVISKEACERIQNFLSAAIHEGAIVERCGIQDPGNELLVSPTIVTNLRMNSELLKRELFGPILRVVKFSEEHEAIRIANSTQYGLTAAVWTQSSLRMQRYKSNLQFGLINFNGPTHGAEFTFPFGGFKNSGNFTREAGRQSLDTYSSLKLISHYNHE